MNQLFTLVAGVQQPHLTWHSALRTFIGDSAGKLVHSLVAVTTAQSYCRLLVAPPPPDYPQHPRWNYKKAKWDLFKIRTNELTRDLMVEGRNINNVIQEFNINTMKAAKEAIPRRVRKNYTPYWTPSLQSAHDELARAREVESYPNEENNNKLQKCKALYLKTKLECTRKSWRDKTEQLNMEKDSTKLWSTE